MAEGVAENIVKQGYLRRGNANSSRLSGLFRRTEVAKWYVLTVRQSTPHLEQYDADVDVFSRAPTHSYSLQACKAVRPLGSSDPPTFCVVCPDRILELVAATRPQMLDWVSALENCLSGLGILKKEVVEHVYSVCPAVVRQPRVSQEVLEEREAIAARQQQLDALAVAPATLPSATTTTTTTAVVAGDASRSSEYQEIHSFTTTTASPTTTTTSSGPSLLPSISESVVGSATRRRSASPVEGSTGAEVNLRPQLPARPALLDPGEDTRGGRPSPLSSSSSSPSSVTAATDATSSSAPSTQTTDPTGHLESLPPPLPARPPLPGSAVFEPPFSPVTEIPNPLIHPITEGSNDSDFVAPEVIAQLCMTRKTQTLPTSPLAAKSDPPTDHEWSNSWRPPSNDEATVSWLSQFSNPETSAEGDTEIRTEETLGPSPSLRRGISLEERKGPHRSPDNRLSSSSSSSSSSSDTSSPSPSPNPEEMLGLTAAQTSSAQETQENVYSLLPSHSGTFALPPADPSDTTPKETVAGPAEHSIQQPPSRPTPRPRHNLLKQTKSQDFPTRGNPSDLPESATVNNSAGAMLEAPKSLLENEQFEKVEYSSVDRHGKEKETALKDENENCYGLMSNAESPAIPPLPRRLDSLPPPIPVSPPPDPYSPNPSSVWKNLSPPSPHTHTKFQHRSEDRPPPLPLPRRNPAGAALRQASQTAATNDLRDLEIPPMPPRRPSPQRSHTTEEDLGPDPDRPPALPSRTRRSFVIKRPQLLTHFNAGEGASAAGGADVNRSSEAGASSLSGLSRKMLLDRAHSLHTVVSLKQTQAEILQSEICMPSLAITLTQKSGHGLALVDWNGLPCVVGWNQQDFPSLHGKLHLGDQLISVNGVKVPSVDVAQKLLRGASTPKITVVLHRMPFAKVFAIRRDAEGQSLGIKREGGTGEIAYVDPNGLAAQHGLSPYTSGVTGHTRCNWFITEINNRAISLFFKDNEIEHRLSAVGREISIVVQPSDFIHEIRKQFKKIKNYKNFITQ